MPMSPPAFDKTIAMAPAVLIPVGPGNAEVARLADLVESIRTFSRDIRILGVDDNPEPRALGVETIRTPLWRHRRPPRAYPAMIAGTLAGLQALRDATWVLKLDTDALVIGPFVDGIEHALRGHGVIGSYDVTITGGIRDWKVWEPRIKRARRRLDVTRHGIVLRDGTTTRIIAQALSNGYEPGAHCLGGAYAVSRDLLREKQLLDWRPWVQTPLSEDVVIGLLAGAKGLSMRSAVGCGEPFGLAHVGLPADPQTLIGRGHSIIHSVKDGRYGSETQLREWFRSRRPAD
jgi:hypothetical protein